MKTRVTLKTAATLAALACAAAYAPTVALAASDQPILFGLIAGTTGAYGATGVQTVQGAQVAVDKLNADGGLLGRPVKLEWYNDNASGTVSGELFKKMVTEGAVAIVGSPDTGPVTAQLSDRYKVLDIGLIDSGGLTIYPDGPDADPHAWAFQFGANSFAWGGKIAEYALKHCPGGIAVIHDQTSYGEGGSAAIKSVYAKAGKKVMSDQPITENWSTGATTGLLPEINAAKKAGADCFVMWLTPQDQAAFLQDMHTLGDKSLIFGNDEVNADDTVIKLAGDTADGVLGAVLTATAHPSEALKAFTEVYKAKFKEEPSQFSATTYDSVMALGECIKSTKSTEQETLRGCMNKLTNYVGIAGDVTFTPKKHVTVTAESLFMTKYDAATKQWVEVKD